MQQRTGLSFFLYKRIYINETTHYNKESSKLVYHCAYIYIYLLASFNKKLGWVRVRALYNVSNVSKWSEVSFLVASFFEWIFFCWIFELLGQSSWPHVMMILVFWSSRLDTKHQMTLVSLLPFYSENGIRPFEYFMWK